MDDPLDTGGGTSTATLDSPTDTGSNKSTMTDPLDTGSTSAPASTPLDTGTTTSSSTMSDPLDTGTSTPASTSKNLTQYPVSQDWSGSVGHTNVDPFSMQGIISNSPIGAIGRTTQAVTGALGKGVNALSNAYQTVAGPLAPNPQTALEYGQSLEQKPENALKNAIDEYSQLAQGNINNNIANPPSIGDIFNKAPSYQDVIEKAPLINKMDDGSKTELARDLGLPLEIFADPMWELHLGGLTETGESAEKAGLLHPNLGNAGEAGQRALLTAGKTPIIEGKPILNAIGAGQTAVRKVLPGWFTNTENPLFNKLIEEHATSPESHANVVADQVNKPLQELIAKHAQEQGVTPEEMNRRMMAYREAEGPLKSELKAPEQKPIITPEEHLNQLQQHIEQMKAETDAKSAPILDALHSGDDAKLTEELLKLTKEDDATHITGEEGENGNIENDQTVHGVSENAGGQEVQGRPQNGEGQIPTGTQDESGLSPREKIGQTLPDELRQIADNQVRTNRGYAQNEGMEPEDNYVAHVGTPQWQKFKNDNFNNKKLGIGSDSPKSDQIAAHDERDIKMPVNEANNLFSQGRGDEVFPNSEHPGTLRKFKDPIFHDDVAKAEANRFLQNAKVNRVGDFMDASKQTFGITPERFKAGNDSGIYKSSDYKYVDSDHFVDDSNPKGRMYFPKEIADFIDGMQNPKGAEMAQGWVKHFLNATGTGIKLANFAYKFGSAPFNYLSNLKLAYLNKLLNPVNVAKAIKLVIKDRLGTLSDDVALHTPNGDITEKELFDKAHMNRAIGMGEYKSSLAGVGGPNILRDNPISKGFGTMHMFAEDASRLPVFMTALERGSEDMAAGLQTRKALYDYSDFGKIPEKIAQYVPFFRFAAKNMPKMMEKMVTDPARTFSVEHARQLWNKSQGQEQNEENQPNFQREEEPWYGGKNENGDPVWIPGGRYNPEMDINKIGGSRDITGHFDPVKKAFEYMASSVNPALKGPAELALNTRFDQDTPIAKDKLANNGMGETTNLAPGIDLPAKETYMANQLSPFSEARGLSDSTVPFEYRLAHLLAGVKPYSQNTDKDATDKQRQKNEAIRYQKNLVKSFLRSQQQYEDSGKQHLADLNGKNADKAMEELNDLIQKFGDDDGQ